MRRFLPLLVVAAFCVAATAIAQDGGGDSIVPVVRSTSVLHLDGNRTCHGDGITLRITPPADLALGWLSVRVDGRQVVRLTGVTGGASVNVLLPRRSARVSTVGETLDGQRISRSRSYRSCLRKPTPPEPRREPPVIVGGGEA